MEKIFESHAHYDDEKFSEENFILDTLFEEDIELVINCGASIKGAKQSLEFTKKYERVYAALGIHPEELEGVTEEDFLWIKQNLSDAKVAAVGEIGLDYYWIKDDEGRKAQEEPFLRQLALAKEYNLPVIIHSRDAAKRTFDIMSSYDGEARGVIHCFSYSVEMAREYVKRGYYLGVGGTVTFKNNRVLREVVEDIPMDYLLLETDSPYLAPEPFRGKRNDSRNLIYVADKIAEIKGITRDDVIRITRENGYRLFPKTKR